MINSRCVMPTSTIMSVTNGNRDNGKVMRRALMALNWTYKDASSAWDFPESILAPYLMKYEKKVRLPTLYTDSPTSSGLTTKDKLEDNFVNNPRTRTLVLLIPADYCQLEVFFHPDSCASFSKRTKTLSSKEAMNSDAFDYKGNNNGWTTAQEAATIAKETGMITKASAAIEDLDELNIQVLDGPNHYHDEDYAMMPREGLCKQCALMEEL